jgi:hypothetical protein
VKKGAMPFLSYDPAIVFVNQMKGKFGDLPVIMEGE